MTVRLTNAFPKRRHCWEGSKSIQCRTLGFGQHKYAVLISGTACYGKRISEMVYALLLYKVCYVYFRRTLNFRIPW